ncbi:hypothetical protein [Shewanella sp. YIC-542]|uniref:hypothetical protein n=1 Tax=Shewanella mytili TaxID=3377111 RepID=UPI00398E4A32
MTAQAQFIASILPDNTLADAPKRRTGSPISHSGFTRKSAVFMPDKPQPHHLGTFLKRVIKYPLKSSFYIVSFIFTYKKHCEDIP